MKTTDELTQEYEQSYPIPTKGTKIMAVLMKFVNQDKRPNSY